MSHRWSCALVLLSLPALACSPAPDASAEADASSSEASAAAPHVVADSPAAAGAYLIRVAGCNDCHTPGYLPKHGKVPESEWLKGSPVGFQGPWGTTYPNNLRRTVDRVSEDGWVTLMKTRDQKPPMPWFNMHDVSERDLRAMYRYIQSLGPPGDSVPNNLPPGEEPRTPYYDFVPKKPGG